MNTTSTTILSWQTDCEIFREIGAPFQILDFTTEEHQEFVTVFWAAYDWEGKVVGNTVILSPPSPTTE